MRRALASLVTGLSLLLGSPTFAAPLDDWLGAVTAEHTRVIIVPRLDAIVSPLGRLWARGAAQPAIASATAGWRDELRASVGFDPLSPAALTERGVDLDGPLAVAWGSTAGWAVIPVKSAAAAEDLLAAATGEAPIAHRVDGLAGWQWSTGVGGWRDGVLFVARSDGELRRVSSARAGADLLGGCPRAKGQADAFMLQREPQSAGCLTARLDPDRLRLDGRLSAPGLVASGWLGPGAGLPALGGEVDLAAAFYPGPLAAAALAQRLAAAHPGLAGMTGQVALAAGPGLTEVVVRLGRRATPAADAALAAAMRQPTPGVEIAAEAAGRWRVKLAAVETAQPATKLPPLDRAWVIADSTRLMLTTRPADVGPGGAQGARARPRAAVSADLFAGASLALWLRAAGAPHDGGAYADALAPLVGALGLEAQAIAELAGAVAYVWAHVGELGLAVRPAGSAIELAVEGVLL